MCCRLVESERGGELLQRGNEDWEQTCRSTEAQKEAHRHNLKRKKHTGDRNKKKHTGTILKEKKQAQKEAHRRNL